MKKTIEEYIIYNKSSIKQLIEVFENIKIKNLYVLDEKDTLIGSVTDGDIRRAFLKNVSHDNSVEEIMNPNPKYIDEDDLLNKDKIKATFNKYKVLSLPIVDSKNKMVDLIFYHDFFNKKNYVQKKNKVFVLAGGLGTRLEPFTKILPKPLIPIGDKPILEKIMDEFNLYGLNDFILSVNYKAEMIKMYFNDSEVKSKYRNIDYVEEKKPLGTIGSLYMAKDLINSTFFITNSDIIIKEDIDAILKFHKKSRSVLTIVGCIKHSTMPYGILNLDNNGFLNEIQEKPSYRHIINTGVYVAEPTIIDYLNGDEKLDITDLFEKLLKENKKIAVYPIQEEKWFDIGQWEEYEKTKKYFEK
jgi:dTDP-glucose pyrophosphorylase